MSFFSEFHSFLHPLVTKISPEVVVDDCLVFGCFLVDSSEVGLITTQNKIKPKTMKIREGS